MTVVPGTSDFIRLKAVLRGLCWVAGTIGAGLTVACPRCGEGLTLRRIGGNVGMVERSIDVGLSIGG